MFRWIKRLLWYYQKIEKQQIANNKYLEKCKMPFKNCFCQKTSLFHQYDIGNIDLAGKISELTFWENLLKVYWNHSIFDKQAILEAGVPSLYSWQLSWDSMDMTVWIHCTHCQHWKILAAIEMDLSQYYAQDDSEKMQS